MMARFGETYNKERQLIHVECNEVKQQAPLFEKNNEGDIMNSGAAVVLSKEAKRKKRSQKKMEQEQCDQKMDAFVEQEFLNRWENILYRWRRQVLWVETLNHSRRLNGFDSLMRSIVVRWRSQEQTADINYIDDNPVFHDRLMTCWWYTYVGMLEQKVDSFVMFEILYRTFARFMCC